MSSERSRLEELIASLKQQRDELNVQIHLGKTEAKEEWQRISAQLDKLLAEYEPLRHALSESADNVIAAMKSVGDEVWAGFQRIRKSL
jgi:uncharacterized coiled-coil DUF342 family protein